MGSTSSQYVKNHVDDSKMKEDIKSDAVVMYSKTHCGYCKMAKQLFDEEKMKYTEKNLEHIKDKDPEGFQAFVNGLVYHTRITTVPQIFICEKFIGGYAELKKLQQEGLLWEQVERCSNLYDRGTSR